MFDTVRVGRISTIDYVAGTASVIYTDRNNEISPQFPFFSMFYEMPKLDEMAVVIMQSNSRTRGFIVGVPYSGKKVPSRNGQGIFYKEFSDGTSILYDPKEKMLSIHADKVTFKSITADNLTVKGKLEAGSIKAEKAVIGELIVDVINLNKSTEADGV